ncbi:hypothetical protein E7T06_11325 [Deinococcus sp. Arct2-2]|uniref:terminase small subunit n=1 Tax=Deinococcus sp. Arct2-2 TaxID=2568653 RepID=UPI0010A2F342|nr:terminase small subunit [Deinococcus sp. Arct2-2]THF69599.1 hypothetical protein E7T06_11325 [Deinococcus sp. Arct2-2]
MPKQPSQVAKTTSKPKRKPGKVTPAASAVPKVKTAYQHALSDLIPKQAKFVRFYVQEPNATKAAKDAVYSEPTAYAIGAENL